MEKHIFGLKFIISCFKTTGKFIILCFITLSLPGHEIFKALITLTYFNDLCPFRNVCGASQHRLNIYLHSVTDRNKNLSTNFKRIYR